MSTDFPTWQTTHVARIEAWMNQQLPAHDNALLSQTQSELYHAMRYALLGGGKRFRALLVYAGGACCTPINADTDTLPITDTNRSLDFLAGAVEALHAYSLVHDDLPCMDDDDFRRGQPTCHKKFGEAMALLAGDALHALSVDWVLRAHPNEPARGLMLAQIFLHAIGYCGMVGGQAIDIASSINSPSQNAPINVNQGLAHLANMHQRKTGALIKASLLMGYLAGTSFRPNTNRGGLPENYFPSWFMRYADDLGLLFQVVDDVLDATQDDLTLGKTAGKDARDNKLTYVSLLGIAGAQEKIEGLLKDINRSLTSVPQHDTTNLWALAQWVARRNF